MDISRADHIAEQLEDLILTGRFGSGERLDEHRLAEEFGVSRTPIREAFQKLAVSGLVQQLPRRGVFVHQPGPVELLEMFEVMAELEAVCGRFAALRISDAALDDLHGANARCLLAVAAKDSDDYYRENEQFHRIIYRESGNRFLEQEANRLHRRLKPFRRIQLQFRGRIQQSMEEHDAILAALRAGDSVGASEALRSHVAVQGEKFHHLMASLQNAAE
ncbi:MAG: GntR family transcriptional regulator [Rhodobacter sp.]|nr:GntR family transcriptional regulator [Rhodobacter sp.]